MTPFRCTYQFSNGMLGEIMSENDIDYFYYEFIVEPIVAGSIPELVLDQRKIFSISKSCLLTTCKPIYVVNKQHFENYLIKYRNGMLYIYCIEFFFPKESNSKMPIRADDYRQNSYHDIFTEKRNISHPGFSENKLFFHMEAAFDGGTK